MLKQKILAFALVFAGTLCGAVPSVNAREKVPVDGALNASLKEKDQVQRTYKRSSGSRRDSKNRVSRDDGRRIKLEVGDELEALGSGGTSASEEAFAFRSRSRDEDLAPPSVNVEQEMREIHRDVGRELKRTPNSEASATGVQMRPVESAPAPSGY